MLDEPLQGDVNVHLVLGGDGVAANLPVLNGFEVPIKRKKGRKKE